jgi:hypothetical protein
MIAQRQPHTDVLEGDGPHRRVIVPVWLRVPGHADIGEVADEDLVLECRRRGYAVFAVGRDIEIPGLLVRGDRPAVVWRGEERRLWPRFHGALRVLAGAYPRAIGYPDLARVLLGSQGAAAQNNAHMIVSNLRKTFPGLIRTVSHHGTGVGTRLVLDPDGAVDGGRDPCREHTREKEDTA